MNTTETVDQYYAIVFDGETLMTMPATRQDDEELKPTRLEQGVTHVRLGADGTVEYQIEAGYAYTVPSALDDALMTIGFVYGTLPAGNYLEVVTRTCTGTIA